MGHNQLTGINLVAPFYSVVSGTMTIADATDDYVEALAYAYDNRLPVPVPLGMGMPTYIGPMYVRHFEVRSRAIDVTVFGGPTQYLAGTQEVTVEFYAEP